MSIKAELEQYYEYDRLLMNNRSLIRKEEDEVQWAMDEGDDDKACKHMQKFMKFVEQEDKLNRCKDEQGKNIIKIIKNFTGDEMTDGEIAESLQRENKLVVTLLRKLEKEG